MSSLLTLFANSFSRELLSDVLRRGSQRNRTCQVADGDALKHLALDKEARLAAMETEVGTALREGNRNGLQR